MNLNPHEILDAFPEEAKVMVPREKKKIKKQLNFYLNEAKSIRRKNLPILEEMVLLELVKVNTPKKLVDNYIKLKRMEQLMNYSGNTNPAYINQKEIAKAKSIRIEDIYEGQLKKSGDKLFGLCPFHNENHGSFVIYTKKNTYFCFGACHDGGDAIKFKMKKNNIGFKEAVKALNI